MRISDGSSDVCSSDLGAFVDRRPEVIHVHGGPGDESTIGYRPLTPYLVNHGYVVFEINNRGSKGPGRTFYHLDDHKHGYSHLDDGVAHQRTHVDTAFVAPPHVTTQGHVRQTVGAVNRVVGRVDFRGH